MRLFRLSAVSFVCLFVAAAAARAENPPDPLRLVPEGADALVEIRNPRRLAEALLHLDVVKQAQALGPVQEILDSTNYRRFYQLVAYFEKHLGAGCPDLLDKLAGGGMVLVTEIGPKPAPVLLVVQGTDEKLMRRFAELGLQILEQEVARGEGKERVEKGSYQGTETVRLGKEFHAAVAGAALLISNNESTLHAALKSSKSDGTGTMGKHAGLAEARKLLPPDSLVYLWVNLESVRKQPQAKDVLGSGRDPVLTVLFGGWLDTARRASCICAAVAQEADGFRLALRMPSGRDGGGAEQSVHVPSSDGAGVLPPLEPRDVVLSHSFYLDVGKFWDDRAKIFTPAQVKTLEEADTKAAVVLLGQKLSQVLTNVGARHRFVAANQRDTGYKRKPKQPLPAFAEVVELRDPAEFTKTANTVLRGVALLAGSQFKLKLVDVKHGDYKLVAYRFAEDAQIAQDPQDLRYNFSPCFVTVGKYFVASSSIDLCHELIGLLEKEAKGEHPSGTPAAMRTLVYAAGNADSLQVSADALLAQTILSRAVTLEEATAETRALIDLVRRLGVLRLETQYTAKDFRLDLHWQLVK